MAMIDRPSSSGFLLLAASGALLMLAVLRPPEIDAWSGLGCALLLAAALCAMTLRPASAGPLLPPWTAGLLPLGAAAILFASCRASASDEASAAAALVLAGLLGRTLASDPRGRPLIRDLMAGLGAVAALMAVVQAHVTLRQDLAGLQAAPGALPAYVVARLESGRPSGPFTLPAALGGFLALSLPLTLCAATASRSGPRRAAAIAFALLEFYALVLTRSVGGLAAAAVSVSLLLPAMAPARYKRPLLAAVPIAAALLAVLFLYARRAEVGAPGGDPLALRAGNWRAAAGMIHDHPLLGTGPGSFGDFYPRALRAGMNETRYAHNSYLQILAGWGVWALLPLAVLVVALTRRIREVLRRGGLSELPFCAAAASFLVHNLVDFTAYLPGVALPAALIVGCALGPRLPGPAPGPAAPRGPRPARAWRVAVVSAALLFFLNHSVARARAKVLIDDARAAALEGRKDAALDLARRAARARPDDPVPRAFIAEWVLTHGMQDEALRREGRRQAAEASRLDPESAILHYDLSLYSRWAGEGGPAYRELWNAHLLFPLKETYRLPPSPASAEER